MPTKVQSGTSLIEVKTIWYVNRDTIHKLLCPFLCIKSKYIMAKLHSFPLGCWKCLQESAYVISLFWFAEPRDFARSSAIGMIFLSIFFCDYSSFANITRKHYAALTSLSFLLKHLWIFYVFVCVCMSFILEIKPY